jgi:hypothetical protein
MNKAWLSKNYPWIVFVGLTLGIAIWQKRRIIIHAKKFLGIKEIGDNMFWDDPDFEKKMRAIGWLPGLQWCVFFLKALIADVYPELKTKTYNNKKIIDYISGSSQTSYANMQMLQKETGMFKVSGMPKAGDIVVWQNYDSSGKATDKGHVGLVTKVNGDKFKTIEGNTSELGVPGQTIAKKDHSLGEMAKKTGLKLKGFIHYTLA